jgi:hypothetical protein
MRDAFRHALFAFIILSDLQQRHNGLRYWLVGGALTHSTGRKMFGTLKMLKKPHRTHKSSARFVGWRFVAQDCKVEKSGTDIRAGFLYTIKSSVKTTRMELRLTGF